MRVSIPFIAGQWSLPAAPRRRPTAPWAFQSPSLRGSGRFLMPRHRGGVTTHSFQSPSLRGSGRFDQIKKKLQKAEFEFQSPSLRGSGRFVCRPVGAQPRPRLFQSPSLRGSGRFNVGPPAVWQGGRFQSPSLRGSGRFEVPPYDAAASGEGVSIPFIAGQWSLHDPDLHGVRLSLVSIPFIAGQWSLLPRTTPLSFCGVWLRKGRPLCDHVLCTRLHVWPKPVILP